MDFSPFMYSGANISGMRMVDLENPKAIAVVDRWKKDLERSSFSLSPIGRDQTQVSVSSNIGGSRNIVFFQGEIFLNLQWGRRVLRHVFDNFIM